ncbi:tetratricopeptide repeat protein, partial [Nostoc sp. NIES-2111]
INGYADDPAASLQKGIELAQEAVAMDDEEPTAHVALGMAYGWMHKLDEAETEIRRGLELLPGSADLMQALISVQIYKGQPTEALETIKAAMTRDPHYNDFILQFKADAQVSLRDFAGAVTTLYERIARNPQSETAYGLLASCLGHLDDAEGAQKAWKRATRLNPNFTVERRRRMQPFQDPADFELRVEGLRKAGIPV